VLGAVANGELSTPEDARAGRGKKALARAS
jgi:hypothetical protein